MGKSASAGELLGRRLRALRTLRDFTQEELGERAHVSGKFVGLIERGTGNPTLDVLARLAAALQLPLWQLVRFEETRPEGPPRNAARAFAANERLTEYLSGRSADEVERALRVIEAALERG